MGGSLPRRRLRAAPLRLGARGCLLLLLLAFSAHAPAQPPPAADDWAVYGPDPNHIWNRVFRALYDRRGPAGEDIGGAWPRSVLEGTRRDQVLALLEEFVRTDAHEKIADPVKRALFQHDLWQVFNWSAALDRTRFAAETHALTFPLQTRLVKVMRAVALERGEIESLPGNYGAAVDSRAYPADYVPSARTRAFLPPDLWSEESNWVLLSKNTMKPVAESHTGTFGIHSDFFVFLSLPGSRKNTEAFLEKLAARDLRSRPPELPTGTRVVLARQMAVIEKSGYVYPTRTIESIQIRVYRARGLPMQYPAPGFFGDARRHLHADAFKNLDQDVFKFRLDRAAYAAGRGVNLVPLGVDEYAFDPESFQSMPTVHPAWKAGGDRDIRELASCLLCHGMGGTASFLSAGMAFGLAEPLKPGTRNYQEYVNGMVNRHNGYYFGYLQALWRLP